MKKKLIAGILLFTLCASLLTGCGQSAPEAPIEESFTPIQQVTLPGAAEQEALLEQNRVLWEFGGYETPWFYAFTDLDHNGRLEVIAATTQGSGVFTYGHLYEVAEDFSGVNDCCPPGSELEGADDCPELVLDALPCFYDSAADRYYYVCEGITRDGFQHQHFAWYALSLKDGAAAWELLASKDVSYDESGENALVTCADAAGGTISEQDYDSAVERRFAGMERSELALTWTPVEEAAPEEAEVFSAPEEAGTLSAPVITKHPSSEVVHLGGKTCFIARAKNAESLTWEFVDPEGQVYSIGETRVLHPNVRLNVTYGDTLDVTDVPSTLNGWGVRARFDGADGSAVTETAQLFVGFFAEQYNSVISPYYEAFAKGENGSIEYLYENGLSEIAAYTGSIGYTLLDLNKDGSPELLIFGLGDVGEFSPEILFDSYTLVDGEPVSLARSMPRMRYFLRTDGSLYWEGSGGAAFSYYAVERLNGASLERQEILFTDLDENGNTVYYRDLGTGDELPGPESVQISEEEFLTQVAALQSTIYRPALTAIYK